MADGPVIPPWPILLSMIVEARAASMSMRSMLVSGGIAIQVAKELCGCIR
ncbi:MAG: hypothetical protein J0H41_19730 [Rhizobiales bacterium]|nr:hypothetical protein [Hyphomicrobiales bacterium]